MQINIKYNKSCFIICLLSESFSIEPFIITCKDILIFFSFSFWVFWDWVSLCGPGCPGIHFVNQVSLKLSDPTVYASQVPGDICILDQNLSCPLTLFLILLVSKYCLIINSQYTVLRVNLKPETYHHFFICSWWWKANLIQKSPGSTWNLIRLTRS